MADIVTLGPFIIKKSWLIFAFSLASGYLFYHYYWRNEIHLREKINDLLVHALFWFLLAWKLSPLLWRTSVFINDPLVLLYYRPGNKETLLAIVITLLYLMVQIFRRKYSFYAVFNSIMLIYIVAAFIYYFFTELQGKGVKWPWLAEIFSHHPLHIYYMAFFLLLTMGVLQTKYVLSPPLVYRSYLSLISLGQMGISLLNPYPYILGIPAYAWWPLVLLIGLVLERLDNIVRKNKASPKDEGRQT